MGAAGDIREFARVCLRERRYLFLGVAFPFFLASSLFRGRKAGTGPAAPPKRLDPGFVAEAYLGNLRHMDTLCRARGIRFTAALQPYNGIGERPLTDADRLFVSAARKATAPGGGSRLDFITTYYDRVQTLGKEESFFADLTTVFDREEGQVFFDSVHFSDRGQRVVGEALAALAKEMGGNAP